VRIFSGHWYNDYRERAPRFDGFSQGDAATMEPWPPVSSGITVRSRVRRDSLRHRPDPVILVLQALAPSSSRHQLNQLPGLAEADTHSMSGRTWQKALTGLPLKGPHARGKWRWPPHRAALKLSAFTVRCAKCRTTLG
jgi:hypothetical protein